MSILLGVGEYLEAQVVWTYRPDRWPAGLITGYVDDDRRFWVRHVVTFRRGHLMPMLRAGIEECREREVTSICISIPADFPPALGLLRVARRLGFEAYATDLTHSYHVALSL